VLRVDAHDGEVKAGEEAIDELGEDAALVLEVEVEGPAGDLGRSDDVFDLGCVVAALREDVAGAGEKLRAALGLIHRGLKSYLRKRRGGSQSSTKNLRH